MSKIPRKLRHLLLPRYHPFAEMKYCEVLDLWALWAWEFFKVENSKERDAIFAFLLQNKTHHYFIYLKRYHYGEPLGYWRRCFHLSMTDLRETFVELAKDWNDDGQANDPEKVNELFDELENHDTKVRQLMGSFALGTHLRLGAESRIQSISPEILELIFEQMWKPITKP